MLERLLKIGEFAALARISIRMLRHYDELGLLKAAYIDRESGYRYYTLEQLPRLNRVLALKDLGLALEDIKPLLDEALSADEIRQMLKLKKEQLRRHIMEEQARLQRVENRLSYIETEGQLPDVDVVIKAQPALHLLSICGSVWPGTLFQETWPLLCQLDLHQHVKGSLTIYHSSLEFQRTGRRGQSYNVEIAYIVDDCVQDGISFPGHRDVRVWDMPAIDHVASLVSTKPDHERGLDARFMWQWMRMHDYRLRSPSIELYLKRPTQTSAPHAMYLTEMLFPIESVQEIKENAFT